MLVDDAKKFDLSRILIDIYGVAYIGHSRLEKLIEKNEIQSRDMMTGGEEDIRTVRVTAYHRFSSRV
ncbi:hypothetical protein AA101099_0405 [Neoasaia chiangmaiensis NBRC 101099]|uniref:hypothetical protein n=1 Tax=Neoasaia chiangmaiensis TaxID=320497 RepID=UPI00118FFC61|nr:hypothetical protein [Neoasaia chiangmaiensis]GBR36572.1 hypothetical protein AA101099_0405 [Neoasaia chiangmaiensis NBRC 101099]GEN15299.1 hypothetical protein NCH01_17300 [Neoasaia chiangmaiensis]